MRSRTGLDLAQLIFRDAFPMRIAAPHGSDMSLMRYRKNN
jgi:hypothetical protein